MGLIDQKRAEIEEVKGQLQEQTNLMSELWKEKNHFESIGDTLKATELEGKYNYIENTVIPQLKEDIEQLEYELGGVSPEGYRKGLIGNARELEGKYSRLTRYVADKKVEIEKAKQRFEELMEQIDMDIVETNAEMEQIDERLKELLGG